MSPPVEVVIINWKRPRNVRTIAEQFRRQSVPCKLTVCECAPAAEYRLDDSTRRLFDAIHEFRENFGPFSRYLPYRNYDRPFTYLHDDDMLPGTRVLEHFLRNAEECPEFGVLGQIGRLATNGRYDGTDVLPRPHALTRVDFIVRAYFVRSADLPHLFRFQQDLGLERVREDDLLLGAAVQRYTGRSCWVTRQPADEEEKLNREELPSPHGLSSAGEHFQARDRFVRMLRRHGWRPLRTTVRGRVANLYRDVFDPVGHG